MTQSLHNAVQSLLKDCDSCPENIDSDKWNALVEAAKAPHTKQITVENQHAITIDSTKTEVELPEGDEREVKIWFRRINDEGGLNLCIGVSKETTDCPPFDHFHYEPILEWAAEKHKVTIKWSDLYYSSKDLRAGNKTPHKCPELAHWAMRWDRGVIGFDHLQLNNKQTEQAARQTVALFLYLYFNGVEWGLAVHCAEEYVRHVKLEPVND